MASEVTQLLRLVASLREENHNLRQTYYSETVVNMLIAERDDYKAKYEALLDKQKGV